MQTEKEIQEMNRVIAEFMGYKRVGDTSVLTDDKREVWYMDDKGYAVQGAPNFNINWDILMPVVEKIESINNDFQVDISLVSCRIFQTSKLFTEYGLLIECHENNKINAVFVAAHSFIIYTQRAGKEENK